LGTGHGEKDGEIRGWGDGGKEELLSPHLPTSPSPHLPTPLFPFRSILKTVLANYALDKLKIEIAGNSHPAFASLILWEGLRLNLGRIFSQAGSLCED